MLQKGQVELKIFNNLYTQTASFNEDLEKVQEANRASYFGSFNSFLYGVSPKLNIGFDLYLRSVRIEDNSASPFSILQFGSRPEQRTAISKFGPRVKFLPFKKIKRLSIQTTLLFPIASDLEGKLNNDLWLDWDTYTWLTQLFYDKKIGDKLQLFTAFETFIRAPRDSYNDNILVITPLKFFLSYFPTNKLTLYGMAEIGPQWASNSTIISSFYTQTGIGGKWQVKPWFELESLVSIFPIGKSQGAGSTFNLGFRLIR